MEKENMIPIVVREDGLYLDAGRLANTGSRRGSAEIFSEDTPEDVQDGLRLPSFVVTHAEGNAAYREALANVPTILRDEWSAEERLRAAFGNDPVVPDGVRIGLFEPLAPMWQTVDVDAAEEEMLRSHADELCIVLSDALRQLEVTTEVEPVDVVVPTPGWDPAWGDGPENVDVQVTLTLTTKQTMALVYRLVRAGLVTVESSIDFESAVEDSGSSSLASTYRTSKGSTPLVLDFRTIVLPTKGESEEETD